jgi:uncharacterized protein (TIGR03118 family)
MIDKPMLQRAGRHFGSALTLFKSAAALLLAAAPALTVHAAPDARFPELPLVCDTIAAPEGDRVAFYVYAVGVQIYRWDGTAWVFVAPEATLYADANHHGQVGTHFGTPNGPAWQSNSGSKVVEQRVNGCTPDPTAIQWLLLRTISHEGDGVFAGVTHVQRVNTVGGVAPSTSGAVVGEERRVPYTADYVFHRSSERFQQNNLVSDLPNAAQLQDTNLVNAWGVTFGGTGPFWVANNGSGKATLYAVTNDVSGTEFVTKQGLEVKIPGEGRPTGVASNNKSAFNGDAFLFATFDGIIAGWRSALGTTAETLATRPTAIYTGLTTATNSAGPLLLAANFAEGTLDVYAPNSVLVAQFRDANAPSDYRPFNVQLINNMVFVMFARPDAGQGRGLIDVFDPETGSFRRFATGVDAGGDLGQINSPWGITLAPLTFGTHGGDLLVGNFGSGTIMSFGLDGKFHGLLKDVDGGAIEIERLWGLTFGNGGRAGNVETLFFAAGPFAESHGLFGSIKPAAEPDSHK